MSEKLEIFKKGIFDNRIVGEQEHSYYPQTTSFGYNDDIEITINQQDLFIDFHNAYLYLECELKVIDGAGDPQTNGVCSLTNNAGAYLFDTISYELNGREIEKVRDPGTTSSLRGLLCYSSAETLTLQNAGWIADGSDSFPTYNDADKKFSLRVPLNFLFSVFHDYQRIITGKHKIRLVRARNDTNCYISTGTSTATIDIRRIELKVKHIQPNDMIKLHLLQEINRNKIIQIPFRKWEFYELPSLRVSNKDLWNVKTSTNLERPRFVIVAFQTNRKDNSKATVAQFDHLNLINIRLWLNSEVYPFESQNFDFSKSQYTEAYQSYCDFQKNFYGKSTSCPLINYSGFREKAIFVIDCSRQNEAIKSSTVDVKLEFESKEQFPNNTRCYCIIIHDKLIEYEGLTGLVRELQ